MDVTGEVGGVVYCITGGGNFYRPFRNLILFLSCVMSSSIKQYDSRVGR